MRAFLGAGVLVALLWSLWHLVMLDNLLGLEKLGAYGRLGSFYGVLSALFSGLAFAAVAATLLHQQRALREQGEATREQIDSLRALIDTNERHLRVVERDLEARERRAHRAAQPAFQVAGGAVSDGTSTKIPIVNRGAPVSEVTIDSDRAYLKTPKGGVMRSPDDRAALFFSDEPLGLDAELELRFSYRDARQDWASQRYEYANRELRLCDEES